MNIMTLSHEASDSRLSAFTPSRYVDKRILPHPFATRLSKERATIPSVSDPACPGTD